jgi:hypothetical protein
MTRSMILCALLASLAVGCAEEAPPPAEEPVAEPAPEPAKAKAKAKGKAKAAAEEGVSFVNLKDGDAVSSPLKVEFGVSGMTVQPAGELVEGTGHHHLIIDGEPTPEGTVVPADDTHIHFGKGQTETEIELAPGTHTLTLQFANGSHQSYGPNWSTTIKVMVK